MGIGMRACIFPMPQLTSFAESFFFDFSEPRQELLPSYRGDQPSIRAIRVRVEPPWDSVTVSIDGTFRETRALQRGENLDRLDLAYVDLWDAYPLGHREFNYVCTEIVGGDGGLRLGARVLVPFDHARFERIA